ncbi:hypothetical protein [Novosphingobium guangzhouense]|uniref:Uncharacterized protein n=1 Tax=Novosphingobium guangzhouense TaxID=1850347 RepID=A0A2K2G385_9SPHN|nr:hypothetical protein [Novosphingobium guangzhouense]PNU05472.1 hypothetical protein A8V01_15925 [Novosphingobium guangzhouense]
MDASIATRIAEAQAAADDAYARAKIVCDACAWAVVKLNKSPESDLRNNRLAEARAALDRAGLERDRAKDAARHVAQTVFLDDLAALTRLHGQRITGWGDGFYCARVAALQEGEEIGEYLVMDCEPDGDLSNIRWSGCPEDD